MDGRRRSPARLLAPISLIVFVLALLIVIASSGTEESSDSNTSISRQQNGQVSTTGDTTTTPEPNLSGTFYTVKTGDTLAGIADQVGVPVTRLQELNPDLDPQTLVSGQKIRIRE
jgi:LysM repeat protein